MDLKLIGIVDELIADADVDGLENPVLEYECLKESTETVASPVVCIIAFPTANRLVESRWGGTFGSSTEWVSCCRNLWARIAAAGPARVEPEMTTACWSLDERLEVGEEVSMELGSEWIPLMRGRDLDITEIFVVRQPANGWPIASIAVQVTQGRSPSGSWEYGDTREVQSCEHFWISKNPMRWKIYKRKLLT